MSLSLETARKRAAYRSWWKGEFGVNIEGTAPYNVSPVHIAAPSEEDERTVQQRVNDLIGESLKVETQGDVAALSTYKDFGVKKVTVSWRGHKDKFFPTTTKALAHLKKLHPDFKVFKKPALHLEAAEDDGAGSRTGESYGIFYYSLTGWRIDETMPNANGSIMEYWW